MDDDELIQLITDAESFLKLTTLGYKQRPVSYWDNTTTNWYKGLSRLNEAVAELRKRRYSISITLSGTAEANMNLIAKISVG